MSDSKRFYYPIFISLILVLGFFLGYKLRPEVDSARAVKFEEVLNALDKMYVDSINKEDIFNQALNEMLHRLDPHSRYISLKELKEEQESMQGSFGGIGVRFQLIQDTICVIHAMPNAPAFFAGVRSGDQIIKINGKGFVGKKITTEMVMANLKGELDTDVEVTVLRRGKIKKFLIQRGEIPLETVSNYFMIDKKIGFIHIDQFSIPTHDEFVIAAEKLLKSGMTALVLDLRGNPGGVMDAATDIADEFLPSGDLIVSTKGKSIGLQKVIATDGGLLEKVKLVVLIDENSASASEILAGAIQDNDRGQLVGRRTYGKGLVQQDQILNDGSSVRLTISRYYTPSGRSIQRQYDGDFSAYMNDESRYLKGELFFKDSIPMDYKSKYKTKKGRVVYGGGGIVPDHFVPLDTTGSSLYLTALNVHQVLSAYVFKSLQGNRKSWATPKELYNYKFNHSDFDNVFGFANGSFKIKRPLSLTPSQRGRLVLQIKREFALQLWQETGVYQLTISEDKELQKAMSLINH